jgi:hypothetical protein
VILVFRNQHDTRPEELAKAPETDNVGTDGSPHVLITTNLPRESPVHPRRAPRARGRSRHRSIIKELKTYASRRRLAHTIVIKENGYNYSAG